MTALAATSGFTNAPLWFTTRSTGLIAFVLLTLTTVLGIVATQRAMASRAWPRFATQTLHRNLSLLAVVFVLAHVVTTLADSYVQISWWSFVLPGTSSYQRWWVALGTVAFDVMAVVVVTSLLRHRLTVRTWRVVHWTSYLLWPLALLHFIGTGTDVAHNGWGLWLGVAALLVVVGGSIVRVLSPNAPRPVRSVVGSVR